MEGMDAFKRPKEHRPDLATTESPKTRMQQLMSDLGLEEVPDRVTSSSDSDVDGTPEEPSDDHITDGVVPKTPSVDYRAMKEVYQRKLEERRHELRLLYQEQLDFSHRREVQIKMMKQAHREAIVEKNLTIDSLSDIITEKDERIAELEGRPFDPELAVRAGKTDKLLDQMNRLTRECTQLKVTLEVTKVDLEKSKDTHKVVSRDPLPPSTPRGKLETYSHEITEMKKIVEENSALLKEVSSLKKDKMALEEEKEDLLQQITQLQVMLEKVNSEHSVQVKKVATLQEELEETKSELQVCRRQTVEQEVSQGALYEQYQGLLDSFKMCQEENKKLKRKVQEEKALLHQERKSFQSQVNEVHKQFESSMDRLTKEGTKRSSSSTVVASFKPHLLSLSTSVGSLGSCIFDMREDVRVLSALIAQQISQVTKKILFAVKQTATEKQQMLERCKEEISERRRLHRRLAELKGRIRVFARVRPIIPEDDDKVVMTTVDPLDDSTVRMKWKKSNKVFVMDRAFGPDCSQIQIFEEVREVVSSVLDGYNVAIFAYGQTGSGKTHTMEGTATNPGVNYHSVGEIFTMAAKRSSNWMYCVHVSMVEIYSEQIYDLLSESPGNKLKIKQGPQGNYVPGLTWVEAKDVEAAQSIFLKGSVNRTTAATTMNLQSSRSHCVVCLHVEGYSTTTGIRTFGKLNLIDLAGSERVARSGATGDRLKEAQYINKSLSSLGDVLHALRAKNSHIPYRNSKLTYLLKDSLDGESKVLMFVQLSPVEKNSGETMCSLTFAERAMVIELGQAKVHKEAFQSHSTGRSEFGPRDV